MNASLPTIIAMSARPTLILVPGAWHGPEIWDATVATLEQQQYRCIRVDLPSTLSNPAVTFGDDVEAVRSSIIVETTRGNDVVVVVHSYGGQVGNSAIRDLTNHKQNGSSFADDLLSGHVIGMAMLASGFTETGTSFLGGLGGKPPPSWKLDLDSGYAVLVAEPRELFYHDLPLVEGSYWSGKLRKQALKALTEGGESAYSGWMDVPVWYMATTEDRALPIQAQRFFVQAAKEAGADVTLKEVESSHSCMLSRPKEIADFIVAAVTSFL